MNPQRFTTMTDVAVVVLGSVAIGVVLTASGAPLWVTVFVCAVVGYKFGRL